VVRELDRSEQLKKDLILAKLRVEQFEIKARESEARVTEGKARVTDIEKDIMKSGDKMKAIAIAR
jgi:hypothetical protein